MTVDPNLAGQLIDQARQLADDRGWAWREPVEITSEAHEGESVWVVRTNVTMRSPSVRIAIRKSDRTIIHAGYLLR